MNKKLFGIALACGCFAALLCSMVGFKNSCDDMYDGIIRIRILANSNSDLDQQLKLKIRDAVINDTKTLYGDVDNINDAAVITEASLNRFRTIALNTVNDCGFDYDVRVEFKDEYFDTRVYDDFTLPAGVYKTAVFYVGEAKGKNWWCVIFPQVCVGSCSAGLETTLKESSVEAAYNPEKYEVRFKTVEIFENIKKYFVF